jgi:hypothetical protein
MSKREDIRNWFVKGVSGKSDYLFIPEGQSDSFMGIVMHTSNPTVAILDFDKCVENLQKQGVEYDDAFDFVWNRGCNRKNHEPVICLPYPELHPNFSK